MLQLAHASLSRTVRSLFLKMSSFNLFLSVAHNLDQRYGLRPLMKCVYHKEENSFALLDRNKIAIESLSNRREIADKFGESL